MHKSGRMFWVVAAVVAASGLVAALAAAADEAAAPSTVGPGKADKVTAQALGRTVFLAECATCHGIRGDGNGPAAKHFAQHPTDFMQGTYKLRTTLSSSPGSDLPTDADLQRTIREGMPSTEMVPFRNVLSSESIAAVAQYIKTLSPRFADPDLPNPETIAVKIGERPFPRSSESIAAGKAKYKDLNCADCHGEQGLGNPDEKDKWGFPVRMVSFRRGTYKSGANDKDLYRTIATGMRGTTMDFYSGTATEQELWQLVDYVRSFADRPTSLAGRFTQYVFGARPSGFAYRSPVQP